MKVLIFGINYTPEQVGVAVYTTGLAEFLSSQGHEVQVVTGQPYYPAWRTMPGHRAWRYSVTREQDVRVLRVPHYVPRQPTGPRRVAHHCSFALAAAVPMLWKAVTWRPHLVLTVAPALLAAPLGAVASRIAGARSWLHVQDFEVEAAFATGLFRSEGVGKLARWFEGQVLGSFDTLSSISANMCARLTAKGVPTQRVIEFRNWADIEAVRPSDCPSSFRKEWGIQTPHIALYSGNIANKQGLEIIVDAARRLTYRQDLSFVIVGEGPHASALKARAAGLENILFKPLQPRERLPELLNLATMHLLPQIAGAADLVLPSKLNNMLASGRPVIAMCAPGTGLAREVEGAGVMVPPGDATALAGAVERLIASPEERNRLGEAARRRAVERWSKQAILADVEAHLLDSSRDSRNIASRLPA